MLEDIAGQEAKPPRCPVDGELLRPEWCGSARAPRDAIDRAQALSAACDVMLVVGTSGVYPAAAVPLIAGEAGATVIDVNPERDALARGCDLVLQGPGEEVLPELMPPCAAPGASSPTAGEPRSYARSRERTPAHRRRRTASRLRPCSPGLRPAAARRTVSATRRPRVSGRFASRTQ